MESPLTQSLLSSSSIPFENSQSENTNKASQTNTSSPSTSNPSEHISPKEDSQAKETHSPADKTSPQDKRIEEDDRVQQINTLLSRLLDNVLEVSEEPLLSLDTTSIGSKTPGRDQRSQCVQKIDLEESQDESECPSQSAPSPSVGKTNKSSPDSSVSSSEDEIADTEIPCSAEDPIFSIKDMLEFSTVKIDFGANFPGMTLEECLEITNKSNQDITVQLSVACLNTECQQLMGYVYGLRRSLYYDINSKHEIVIEPHCSASFTVVLKAPRMKIQDDVTGEILASVKGVEGIERICLSSSVYIPQIICPKELYNHETKCSVINLAINKKSKKLDTKFSLKNLSEVPVTLQLSFYQPKNVEEDPAFECLLFPSSVTIPAKGLAVVNLGLKNHKAIAKRTEQDPKSFKKVLVGTMRGCALIYSFLLCVELH